MGKNEAMISMTLGLHKTAVVVVVAVVVLGGVVAAEEYVID